LLGVGSGESLVEITEDMKATIVPEVIIDETRTNIGLL